MTFKKGNHPSTEFKKGHIMSEETKRKMSEAKSKNHPRGMLGKMHTEEWKKEHSKRMLGKDNPFYNKTHTKEIREKIRQSRLGKISSKETREKLRLTHLGERNHFYGRTHTEEVREKLRKANLGKQISLESRRNMSIAKKKLNRFGPESTNWMGGLSFLPYTYEFNNKLKNKIKKRDNYRCQLCNDITFTKNNPLSVHHIDYDKTNCNEDNLIALCRFCNSSVNKNREDWTRFFQNRMRNIIGERI